MAMTICEDGEDRLVLWEKGLVSDKMAPWEERAKKWAVAVGHMQMRRPQGHPGEGAAGMSCDRSWGSEA